MPTPGDAQSSFRTRPGRRLRAEAYCFYLTLIPHPNNDFQRTLLTIIVVVVWAILELGKAFGYAELPTSIDWLRLFVGVLLGRMWGIEFNNFANLPTPITDSEDDDSNDDTNS